jgi:hypothetical protein
MFLAVTFFLLEKRVVVRVISWVMIFMVGGVVVDLVLVFVVLLLLGVRFFLGLLVGGPVGVVGVVGVVVVEPLNHELNFARERGPTWFAGVHPCATCHARTEAKVFGPKYIVSFPGEPAPDVASTYPCVFNNTWKHFTSCPVEPTVKFLVKVTPTQAAGTEAEVVLDPCKELN